MFASGYSTAFLTFPTRRRAGHLPPCSGSVASTTVTDESGRAGAVDEVGQRLDDRRDIRDQEIGVRMPIAVHHIDDQDSRIAHGRLLPDRPTYDALTGVCALRARATHAGMHSNIADEE
jgi:hypothetical protein